MDGWIYPVVRLFLQQLCLMWYEYNIKILLIIIEKTIPNSYKLESGRQKKSYKRVIGKRKH